MSLNKLLTLPVPKHHAAAAILAAAILHMVYRWQQRTVNTTAVVAVSRPVAFVVADL